MQPNMRPMDQLKINQFLQELKHLGDNGILVLSHSALDDLEEPVGSFRQPSGKAVEVKQFDEKQLRRMLSEDATHFIVKMKVWIDEGRLVAANQNGDFLFREDIAKMIGPEVTFRVKNKEVPIEEQKVLQGRVKKVSEEDYDTVRESIDVILSSLIPVEIQQTDKQPSRQTQTTPSAPPLREEAVRQRQTVAGPPEKRGRKQSVFKAESSEVRAQEKATKKKHEDEKARARRADAKKMKAEDALEFEREQKDIQEQDIKTDKTKPRRKS